MRDILAHSRSLLALSVPLIASALLQQAAQIITFLFIGRLDATAMAASTLGNMLCNVSGYTLIYGMCTALDTLTSQAFGAKRYRLVGLHAQRAIAIMTLCSIPVLVVWMNTSAILQIGLQIEEHVADEAGRWAYITAYGLWPTIMFEVLRRFLQG
jgi:MATE family multidrug resistance protein